MSIHIEEPFVDISAIIITGDEIGQDGFHTKVPPHSLRLCCNNIRPTLTKVEAKRLAKILNKFARGK